MLHHLITAGQCFIAEKCVAQTPAYRRFRTVGEENSMAAHHNSPRTRMIAEQIGVAHVGLQHIHRLVPRHVPHLEHRGAAAGGAGQEAGAQRMGAEVGGFEAEPAGIGLDDLADGLGR